MRLLDLVDAAHRYPNGDGLLGATLSVGSGEVHALVGMNGAGKSTLMRVALGMTTLTSGAAHVMGHPVARAAPEVWARVGHSVDDRGGYPDLSVYDNLRVAARLHGVMRRAVDAAVDAVLSEMDLTRYARRRQRDLSAGNRQRVSVASTLVHAPTLLVLDEPTATLDPAGVLLVRAAIERRAGAGGAVLVSSHHLDEVARVADTITVLNNGRVIGRLDPRGTDIEVAFFAMVRADAGGAS